VPPVVEAARHADVSGMTIGVVKELSGEGYQAGVEQRFAEAVETLTGLGAKVVEVSCPHFGYALPAYYLIAPSEASSNLARFDSVRYGLRVGDDGDRGLEEVMSLTRAKGFGAEVKRRIILGTYALSSGYYDAYYGQAQKVRSLITRDFTEAFAVADVLVSPAAPTVAFPLGEKLSDPLAMYRQDLATIPSNLYGGPAMSLPCGLADGLPVGLQIMAPTMRDELLYQVGAAFEATMPAPTPPRSRRSGPRRCPATPCRHRLPASTAGMRFSRQTACPRSTATTPRRSSATDHASTSRRWPSPRQPRTACTSTCRPAADRRSRSRSSRCGSPPTSRDCVASVRPWSRSAWSSAWPGP